MTNGIHGCMCDAISNIYWRVSVLGLVFSYGLLSLIQVEKKLAKYIYFIRAYARDTGGPPAFACNVAIFLCELVTCMTYGQTL